MKCLCPSRCYIPYSPITTLAGGVPVGIETFAEDQFKLTAETLAGGHHAALEGARSLLSEQSDGRAS